MYSDDFLQVPSPTITPRKKKLLKKLRYQTQVAEQRKKQLAVLRSKNWRLEKKNAELTGVIEELKKRSFINQENADALLAIDPLNKDILKRVLGTKEKKYSPTLRQFALTLHFISPRAYTYVRKSFNTCLPHPRTLTSWYQGINGEPGFSEEALSALTMLVKKSTRQIYGALSFDEMAIRKCVEFDGKNYVGFVNFGNIRENHELPVAKEALVFMLTCINGSWKIPVGYFLIDGISAEQKCSLVKQALELIEKCGVNVVALTFDGCRANFSMAKLLGCQLDNETIDHIFKYNGKPVAIFPDPSHMLKLVRNTLGEKHDLTNREGYIISWGFVTQLVDLQENEGFHLANKVTAAHVHFKKQIMKVKLAAQTLSASVADAIEFCAESLALEEFKNCGPTVEFIKKFNSLFDIMNSRNLNSYGYKKPLLKQNCDAHKEFLENMYRYITGLKLNNVPILMSNRKTGFLGFLMCIKSLIYLCDEMVRTNRVDFLCSYKMSQDHLEYFFSAIRARGGFNNNPSARQFQSAFKRMLIHGELKHIATGNCIPLSDVTILTYTKPHVAINNTTERNRLLPEVEILLEESEKPVLDNDHDYLADPSKLTEFAKQIIVYIAGFVVQRLEKQIKCAECLSVLTQEKFNSLQLKKDKGGLHYPSNDVIIICEMAEKIYASNKLFGAKNPLHHLTQKCLKECLNKNFFINISQHFKDFPLLDNHYSLLIKSICEKYLSVRMHYTVKKVIGKQDKVRNMYTKLILFKGQ